MKTHIGWSCEFYKNTGEGQLARKFINKYFKNKNVKIITPKSNFYLSQYVYQIYGIFVLWKYYFKGERLIYLNYLPLWNFIIFLLSPPKTIFGPITGSIQINRINNIKSIVRYFLMPFLYRISLIILNFRAKKIIFATNLLIRFVSKNIKKKIKLNFVYDDFNYKNYLIKRKKKYDLIVYYRKHENKFFSHHMVFIKKQIKLGKKVLIIGDKINIKNLKQLKRINKNKVSKFIRQSKFALSGDDNLFSLFNLECLENKVKIIFNYKLKFQISKINKKLLKPYNFELQKFTK